MFRVRYDFGGCTGFATCIAESADGIEENETVSVRDA
jgi:hypothetical protein